ncbi:dipeptide-binding protein DppE [Melissococcus plutonius]|uniref:peptide ABC transporter substrate-binding protein n=1 Tax=Melissococcus plutonius TaxID=33970 RepID=UPI00065E9126|nr:peptide ABC transporter substrate-binding protein [Melissococcus plutonius]AIM25353.1 dipeptide-binding protein DppE [Melissococcus plutonius S1]KMT24069.1 dipeptide-binding protein DppE [Melissococcus plutonius]KMT24222.1 dipeptide-binding protein DppE [Melissococcus plutonius]KMT25567.1 dipeptide-binding protein DppE [Melissococcus plutonius]KMT28714.1 dipeptide-binding protein DppE [Melissococcus plutonius]
MKKWLFTAITASGLLFSLSACGGSENNKEGNSSEQKQVLKVVANAEIPTMDVSKATDEESFNALTQVMEGLYLFDKDSVPIPGIAEQVARPTNDGKTYTIKLRKNAKWSNGEPVTAKDFVYSWQRTTDPKTGSEYIYLFDGFKNYEAITKGEKPSTDLGVKAIDDYTLEINLDHPIPYLSSLLARPTFYPLNQKYVEKKGKDYGRNSENMIYNGPFVMKDWDGTGIDWKFEKNKNYYNAKKVNLNEVDVQVSKEVSKNVNLFKSNAVDVTQIKGEYVDQEKNTPQLVIRNYPSTNYLQYNFNSKKNKIFTNVNARNAMTKLVNTDQIAKNILKDGSKKISDFVPTGLINKETKKDFAKESGRLIETNNKEAKALWKKAKNELGIKTASVELLTSDLDSSKKLAEYLEGLMSENLSGLKVTVSSVPFKNRMDRMSSGDFDIVLAGWLATYPDPYDFLQLLQTGNVQNYGKYSNTDYDKLLKDSATTYATDNQKRWDTLLDAQKVMMKDSPITPLYQSAQAFLVNDKVKGLTYRAIGAPYYKDITIK